MQIMIIIGVLVLLALIYYEIQKNIGEQQAADWAQYVKDHPEYFKKPEFKETKKMTVTSIM